MGVEQVEHLADLEEWVLEQGKLEHHDQDHCEPDFSLGPLHAVQLIEDHIPDIGHEDVPILTVVELQCLAPTPIDGKASQVLVVHIQHLPHIDIEAFQALVVHIQLLSHVDNEATPVLVIGILLLLHVGDDATP